MRIDSTFLSMNCTTPGFDQQSHPRSRMQQERCVSSNQEVRLPGHYGHRGMCHRPCPRYCLPDIYNTTLKHLYTSPPPSTSPISSTPSTNISKFTLPHKINHPDTTMQFTKSLLITKLTLTTNVISMPTQLNNTTIASTDTWIPFNPCVACNIELGYCVKVCIPISKRQLKQLTAYISDCM